MITRGSETCSSSSAGDLILSEAGWLVFERGNRKREIIVFKARNISAANWTQRIWFTSKCRLFCWLFHELSQLKGVTSLKRLISKHFFFCLFSDICNKNLLESGFQDWQKTYRTRTLSLECPTLVRFGFGESVMNPAGGHVIPGSEAFLLEGFFSNFRNKW